jgi:hypothetical protein
LSEINEFLLSDARSHHPQNWAILKFSVDPPTLNFELRHLLQSTSTMDQEDEDAFLYGDTVPATASTSAPSASAARTVDQEMEQASEGEIDEEDEDEDEEDDSVRRQYRD